MSFDLDRLRTSLRPFRLHWFSRLRSTNDHAAALRRRKVLFAPSIILTGHQLAGRGRGSNAWWSGAGTLTVTFVLAADDAIYPHQIPLICGLAVRNAAAELAGGAAVQLKWPNDLLFEGKKLAGLLCERVEKVDLIGLGLNVNVKTTHPPAALRNRITSLSQIVGGSIDINTALSTVAHHLHTLMSHTRDRPFSQLLAEYDRHHALVGRRIRVIGNVDEKPITGVCKGMDSMGRLLVKSGSETHRIIAGHIELL
jgi:BirA family biotin operon repressor/biotin-[acetyl-CoA-carboxylase] ligase